MINYERLVKMKKIVLITFFVLLQKGLFAQDGNYTNVNGVKLYFETYGKGQPLVLLHYMTGSHEVWEQWIDSLSQDYKLIIPDLRGHGKSTNPTGEFGYEIVAQDIYALMDELEIENFMAMGASSGAMTLIHMATMDSTRIDAMILIGGTIFFDDQYRELVKGVTYETYPKESLSNMRTHHPAGDEQIKMLLDQFRAHAFTYDDMNFTSPYLSLIKCPTLIIHGDRDKYFQIDIPVEMYKAIPNSFLWIFPNGGHLPNWKALWSDKFLEVSKLFFSEKL